MLLHLRDFFSIVKTGVLLPVILLNRKVVRYAMIPRKYISLH
ncbi:hypothetical protein HMPREF0373_02414 [Eubacterium ramulus ATCC 29099]|uniref:Uncharacterized protein n=1 Tax=Eubacterium ramulus ATCC 29099 TaxID=1256908 RepID=U2PIC0_EUBRA|nr:hypothetical protein HMPREF0373_02414 [Eubacterium ramulus ATCC 29099]